MKKGITPAIVLCLLLLGCARPLVAGAQQDVTSLIRQKDSLFWEAYNSCNVPGMQQYFTDDVEFYHDKGGITLGLPALTATLQKNLCGKQGYRLRREAVKGTVHVFPMQSSGVIYGAIISGDHHFYVTDGGRPEYRDGLAKFSQLWVLRDGVWKMSRVLSYDHQPVVHTTARKEQQLSPDVLRQFAGSYASAQKGTIIVKSGAGNLLLTAGGKTFTLYPETPHTFFVKEQGLTFEFGRDSRNKVARLTIRENGTIVEQAVLQ